MSQISSQPFRARARTIDMLGRQQIAGIPTAISELFKNAHDAYATLAVVDYYEGSGLFILRDNGGGMTRQDFVDKWLVIGTESKFGREKDIKPPFETDLPRRVQMGEKGIGRLAISVIGPQVLVMTRAKREDGLHNLVTAFIHWGLYELPGVDLDSILVPIREYEAGEFPTAADIQEMTGRVKTNLRELLEERYPNDPPDLDSIGKNAGAFVLECARIWKDLKAFTVNPEKVAQSLEGPQLTDEGTGTQFYIYPSDPSLAQDLRKESRQSKDDEIGEQSRIRKLLLGFINTMTRPAEQFETKFNYHEKGGGTVDLIGGRNFWDEEDFRHVDHLVEGAFDEFGYFRGTVRVYDRALDEFDLPWPGSQGRETACGPFSIKFGYVQGAPAQSLLEPETWAEMTERLNQIGGLYIYRDGMRVLPYGDNDYDFLDIEKRRSLSAGRYFFSYRRLFGVVEITHAQNSGLQEKAGREGFRDNRAYRDFRGILRYLFDQLARQYFGIDAKQRDLFEKRRDEIEAAHKARKERNEKADRERHVFGRQLDDFFSGLQKGKTAKETKAVLRQFRDVLEAEGSRTVNSSSAARIAALQRNAQSSVEAIRNTGIIRKPAGIGFSAETLQTWQAYREEFEKLDAELYQPTIAEISRLAESQLENLPERAAYDEAVKKERLGRLENARTLLDKRKAALRKQVEDLLSAIDETFAPEEERLKQIAHLLEDESVDDSEIRDVDTFLPKVEQDTEEIADNLQHHLAVAEWSRTPEGVLSTSSTIAADIESELFSTQEKLDTNVELAQLGMALEVIDHEFTNSITAIRHNLRSLKAWADTNPGLKNIYDELRTNFDHLDGFLKLFTPLQRRLYRKKVDFNGASIGRYLQRLFASRLEEQQVELDVTPAFSEHVFKGYPSSFYPVFVNLVDNALHWIGQDQEARIIRLDVDGNDVSVSDTGSGIPVKDWERVFELGFSRRPGGRGMGLYIARQSLHREGFSLRLLPPHKPFKTVFALSPIETSAEDKQ